MANSSVPITAGVGTNVDTRTAPDGDHRQVTVIGDETTADIAAVTAANGLDVDVTRLPSIPAGTNNIGDVDVLTLPALPAGTNNIGDVDVLTLPTIPAGDNNIGNVDVLTVPTDPFGTIAEGAATAGGTGSISAKLRLMTTQLNTIMTEIQALTTIEDAVHANGDTGIMALGVRKDAAGTLAGTDGDYAPLQMDASGNLRVTGGGGGQQFAEDAAHASGDLGTMVLGVRNDAGTVLAGTTGDYIPLSLDANGYLRVNVAAGGTSGVQYNEGDVDSIITGTAMFWEDTGDTLRAVSVAKPMPVAQTGIASVALEAGENVIGAALGVLVPIRPVMTISAAAYAAGRVIGGELTLTNAMRITSGTGMLHSLTMVDSANVKPELRCLLFDANPVGTFTNNTTMTINSTDHVKVIADLHIASTDYVTYDDSATDFAVASLRNIGQLVSANGSRNIFAVFFTVGAPTFTSTTQLTPTFWFVQN